MSFLTEDPDTVNAIITEDMREVLARIRTSLSTQPKRRGLERLGTVYKEPPQPEVLSNVYSDPWGEDMHPKD